MKKKNTLIIVIGIIIAVILVGLAVINIYSNNILAALLDISAILIIAYAILDHFAFIWRYSEDIQTKYTFTCKYCESKFTPTFWVWLLTPHIASKRLFKCPQCGKIHYMSRK